MQSQKRQNDLCSFPRQTIQYHSNPSLCPNQDLLELTPKKDVLFIIGDWNVKVGSQDTPEVWNEAGQRLMEFCQENALIIENTLFQQHKRRLYRWSTSKSD